MKEMFGSDNITWRKNAMYVTGSKRIQATVRRDTKYPQMWRAYFPDGSVTDICNYTRARDAAFVIVCAMLNRHAFKAFSFPQLKKLPHIRVALKEPAG